jgi:excisionase family DNA binding protein
MKAVTVAPITADDLRAAIHQPDAQVLTVEEFASYMRISKMTVYRMINDGDLGVTRPGGRCFRIPIDSAVTCLNAASS